MYSPLPTIRFFQHQTHDVIRSENNLPIRDFFPLLSLSLKIGSYTSGDTKGLANVKMTIQIPDDNKMSSYQTPGAVAQIRNDSQVRDRTTVASWLRRTLLGLRI